MFQNKITGKVIRILSDTEIIINIGINKEAKIGQKFKIYEPGEEIIDSETNKSLGILDYIKGTVEITEIHDEFSVAQKIVQEERIKNRGYNPLSSFNNTKTETVNVIKPLPVNEQEIKARNIKNPQISINDPVKSI